MHEELATKLNEQFKHATAHEVLAYFLDAYKGKIVLSSSMSAEDQVLTEMVVKIDKQTPVFTLDTGRLFPETYDLIERTTDRFGIKIKTYFPDYKQVEDMVHRKGINLFYSSIENRKECCRIRKLEPLKRAFKNMDVWICGLRREQSVTRLNNQMVEWDNNNKMIKLNPLINWSEKNVWNYIENNMIPYNKLHNKGFPSIGCQPCTRAVEPGQDIRAGRWWWENPELKECGLHNRR